MSLTTKDLNSVIYTFKRLNSTHIVSKARVLISALTVALTKHFHTPLTLSTSLVVPLFVFTLFPLFPFYFVVDDRSTSPSVEPSFFHIGLTVCSFSHSQVISSFICSGGKSGAATIQTDNDFHVALEHLLSKPKGRCMVSVEFNLDNMMGFRIQQPVRCTFLSLVFYLSDIVPSLAPLSHGKP